MTSGLRFIFGPDVDGDRWEKAVKECERSFVRSRSQLALMHQNRDPQGHRLTAWEAWDAYGRDVVDEAIEHSGAILKRTETPVEAGLRDRCNDLGISWSFAVEAAGLSEEESAVDGTNSRRLSIKALGAVAFALGLDERFLSFRPDVGGDRGLANSLKALRQLPSEDLDSVSESTVAALAESVSVMRAQVRLRGWLGEAPEADRFEMSNDYGEEPGQARQVGYVLGEKVRETLGLGSELVVSVRDLLQDRLGIPVVSTELPAKVDAVMVSSADHTGKEFRGVAVNSVGQNENAWVRRVTLARGLGHALFDPVDRFESVRIVRHLGNGSVESAGSDLVDQRAYAFALSFLAPVEGVKRFAALPVNSDGITQVMWHFGICESAARRRIESCHSGEATDIPGAWASVQPPAPAVEAENLDWGGEIPCTVKVSRRGKFAEVVMGCFKDRLISGDTAALYLGCKAEEFLGSAEAGV